MEINCNIINWNVRGLNSKAKRDVVRETIASSLASVACLQETKLAVIDPSICKEILGSSFDGFYYLPASQTRGGILLAWNSSSFSCSLVVIREYSITANVVLPSGGSSWLTVVYGPQEEAAKDAFLLELRLI